MLALSQLLRHSVFQVIASYVLSFFYTSTHVHYLGSACVIIVPPLTFCNEKYGALYNSVMIYYWFIVGVLLGLYRDPSPSWCPRSRKSFLPHKLVAKSKTPLDPNYRHFKLFYILYILINCFQVYSIFHEDLPISSLCATPMVLLCGSSIMTIRRYQTNKVIHQLFNPSPCKSTNHKNLDHTSFIHTSCNQ